MARLSGSTTFAMVEDIRDAFNALFDPDIPCRVDRNQIISWLESVPFNSEEVMIDNGLEYNEENKSLHLSLQGMGENETMKLSFQIGDQDLITMVEYAGNTKTVPYFLSEFTLEEFCSLWR